MKENGNNRAKYLIAVVVLIIGEAIFLLQNVERISITFLLWEIKLATGFVILISFVIGILISLFIFIPSVSRRKKALKVANKKIEALENELKELKEKSVATETSKK